VTPALEGGVVRRLQVSGVGAEAGLRRPPHIGNLKVLLVENPTEDLPGAKTEAAAVRSALADTGVELDELQGKEATVGAIMQALTGGSIDILHYCGHAFFEGPGETQSGLLCANKEKLTLKDLRALTTVPRVAFVNACQGGRMRGARDDVPRGQAFAEFFLRAGIDAYLGTFWLVSDDGAEAFAHEVYQALAQGVELGAAVVRGRRCLHQQKNPDWANYLLYGDSSFVLVRAPGDASD
jgi:CHAT domain-containing protein